MAARIPIILLALSLSVLWGCGQDQPDLQIAVSSNFSRTMSHLVTRFESASGYHITMVAGSTGKHYAQILHGAPFDLFFAADTLRPALLERAGLGVPHTRFTYAVGRLVLWSPNRDRVQDGGDVLYEDAFRHLAIANPELAPYGVAARQTLENMDLWKLVARKIVRGENVGQAFQFVQSGNAELGFVAYSQILDEGKPTDGSRWIVPEELYDPILQQAVGLRESRAMRDFLSYIRGEEARALIVADGYRVP